MKKLLFAAIIAVLPFSVSAKPSFIADPDNLIEPTGQVSNVSPGYTTKDYSIQYETTRLTDAAKDDRIDTYIDVRENSAGDVESRTRYYNFKRSERAKVRGLDNFTGDEDWINDVYRYEPGLEKAHRNGWTGEGQRIHLWETEGSSHGISVYNHASAIAPGAEISYDASSEIWPGRSIHLQDHLSNVKGESAAFVIAKGIRAENANGEATHGTINDALNRHDITKVHAAQYTTRYGLYDDCNAQSNTIATCNSNYRSGYTADSNIFVGALDRDGNYEEYNIRAGEQHKDRYITAVGTFGTGDGSSSFAAPRVAGAIALVRQKFPNLTHEQSRDVILKTADDLGAPGNDPIYGVGRLNVNKALNPYGRLR